VLVIPGGSLFEVRTVQDHKIGITPCWRAESRIFSSIPPDWFDKQAEHGTIKIEAGSNATTALPAEVVKTDNWCQ
jgi:hypothetical protein